MAYGHGCTVGLSGSNPTLALAAEAIFITVVSE